LLVQRVDIRDEDVDGTLARQAPGLARRLQVYGHVVPLDAGVERRLTIRELRAEAQHVAVVLHAPEHVLYHQHRRGAAERDGRGMRHGVLLSAQWHLSLMRWRDAAHEVSAAWKMSRRRLLPRWPKHERFGLFQGEPRQVSDRHPMRHQHERAG